MVRSNHREALEKMIAMEEFKELGKKLSLCHFRSSIDHRWKCKDLAMQYYARLKDHDKLDPNAVRVFFVA